MTHSLPLLLCVTIPALAGADDLPWHADGWSHRAVVAVADRADAGVDAAAVAVHHAGLARADANDYRIFDAAGAPVPYEVVYHHPHRRSLIHFRADVGPEPFAVYYGHADAPPDTRRALSKPGPGHGPPTPGPDAGGWIPRAGLVLTTMRRPTDLPNPRTVEDLGGLIAASPGLDGAGHRANISDSFNPFGDSDYFISIYRGWIRLPSAGRYSFCTASNEASFSFLDGAELVHWPGRHTEKRGERGEKKAEHDLEAGLHHVEYCHEEVLLYSVAFLGYRPPGAPHHVGIPDGLFPQPHRARVRRYERAGGRRAAAPAVALVDSLWPKLRPEGQYTRFRFAADAGSDPCDLGDWRIAWDFGDGLTARGPEVEHVYFRTGSFRVTMSIDRPGGEAATRHWLLTVYPIEHLDGPYQSAEPSAYRPHMDGCDRTALADDDLVELARYYVEIGDRSAAAAAAQALLARADVGPALVAEAHWICADGADDRVAHLRAALQFEPAAARRVRITAALIHEVGVRGADLDACERLYDDARKLVGSNALGGAFKTALRDVAIAIGDARLHALKIDAAAEAYHLAEALEEPPIPLPVRQARIGSYHDHIVRHLAAGRADQAGAVAERWRRQFPADQMRGELPYWLGRIAAELDRPADAIAPLKLAITLAEGAEFEADARYRLAHALLATGDRTAYRDTLQGLVRSGLAGPLRAKALAELAAPQP